MAEESDLEKSEAPTQHRQEKAREEGQIPRSRELTSMLMLLVGCAMLWLDGAYLTRQLAAMLTQGLHFDHGLIGNDRQSLSTAAPLLSQTVLALVPLFAGLILVALGAPMLLGGITFNPSLIKFDIAKKLNYGYTDFMSYSIDFRRRILSIKKHEGLSIRETAKRFHIGTTTIVRWTKQIDARPATSRQRKIDKLALERDVEQYPDAYQRERAERFGVCQMAICKTLKKLQLTYKKKLCVIQKSTKTLDKHSNKKYNSIKMKEKPLFSLMKVVLITIPHVHTVIRYLEKDVTA